MLTYTSNQFEWNGNHGRAENAALRADKERLDWLTTTSGSDWAAMILNEGKWITRAAIDAAMKEASK